MGQRIFLSAGEPSGDQHAARLVAALRHQAPTLEFQGFGGPALLAAGVPLEAEIASLAVMGIGAVIPQIRFFWQLAERAKRIFQTGNIDAVVLIDYPGFNWHIAKHAKAAGVPVFYYLPPQLWAWAPWRINKIHRYVDEVLSVLSFEYDWYRAQDANVTFVGHPFFDAVESQPLQEGKLHRFQAMKDGGQKLVAVLPGSRRHEIERNGPLILESVRRLHKLHPQARFLVAGYRQRHCDYLQGLMSNADLKLPIEFQVDCTSEIIAACTCALVVSGSVSLEMLARRKPAVVLYRIGRMTHTFARMLVNVPSFSLPNLIADEKIYPEFLSVGNPEPAIQGMVGELHRMLSDPGYLAAKTAAIESTASTTCRPGASKLAAAAILQRISVSKSTRAA